MTTFVRQNWLLVAVFLTALALAVWFASHAIMDAIYFNDPRNVDVDLKRWMTPRYIVMTYDLPREFVLDLLSVDGDAGPGIHLGRLAQERGVTMEELTTLVRDAAVTYREGQP